LAARKAETKKMVNAETELYAPVKTFLQAQGFNVAGEVHSCDLVAVRGDEVVVVELKRAFCLELIFQTIQRQVLTQTVYAAIEKPRKRGRKRWRNMLKLCRMLGVGLLTVELSKTAAQVHVALEPTLYKARIVKKKQTRLLTEFRGRSADFNIGGSTRRKIMTAYREQALRLASHLQKNGPSKPAALAQFCACARAGNILLQNWYGWFERVTRGVYALTAEGQKALLTYAAVVNSVPKRSKVS